MEENNSNGLSLEEVKRIAHIDELQLAMQNKRRKGYHIYAYLTSGNNYGEKRILQSLEERFMSESAENYLMGLEGYSGVTVFKNMENYDKVTKNQFYNTLFKMVKNSGRGWDMSEKGGLQKIIMVLGLLYKTRNDLDFHEVILKVDDREEKGLKPEDKMNKVIEDKGMSAFEAYALLNKTIPLYGLEDKDLLDIQTKLSYGNVNKHFYRVAKLRSKVMFNNLIDLMDKEERDKSLVYITGFHHMVFKELTQANDIDYESVFVHKLPNYVAPAQNHEQSHNC